MVQCCLLNLFITGSLTFQVSASLIELLVDGSSKLTNSTRTALLCDPLGSEPAQLSGARDSQLTCVQSGQCMPPAEISYIHAGIFQRKSNIFSGYKTPPVRTSDPTIQYRSDLRYVPMLGMFLSYECSLLRSFGSPGLRGDLPKKKSKLFQGEWQMFSRE